MAERPFLSLLLIVVFVAFGVFGVLFVLTMWFTAELGQEEQLAVLVLRIFGTGLVLSAYGLYKGYRWGWFLGTVLILLDMLSNMVYDNYLGLTVDAGLFLIFLLVAKHYVRIPRPFRPRTPVLPPPVTVAYADVLQKRYRFVRRKK